MTTVWITKYALTKGIFEAEVRGSIEGRVVRVKSNSLNGYGAFYGDEWQLTREEAVAQARKMKAKKLASLNKQIEKLAAMIIE